MTGKRAVQVDHVQPARALRLELGGLGAGIVGKHGGVGHLAAPQPHAYAILEVDGRIQRQHQPALIGVSSL
jgi:hypothetical protein